MEYRMKKGILALTLLDGAMSAQAGVLEQLKEVPASKYQQGKFKLELYAHMMTVEAAGEKFGKTGFRFSKARVERNNEQLVFIMSYQGKSRKLNKTTCERISDFGATGDLAQNLTKKAWPDLADKEYAQLAAEFIVVTELVAKDNNSLKLQCS